MELSLFAAVRADLPKNLVQCLEAEVVGVFAVGTFPAPCPRRSLVVAASESERARRVALNGTRPQRSPCFAAIKDDLPRNMVQCLIPEPTGAFAVGTFPSALGRRSAVDSRAEAERIRRVQEHGTAPLISPCCAAIKNELPRNLVSCDLARTTYGAFALTSSLPTVIEEDEDEPLRRRKAASFHDLHLLSTSPTSVTASNSVGNLMALH